MANKPLDPMVESILRKYHDNPKAALWNCHGVWCVYHRDLEIIAAKAGIAFDRPAVLENDGANKSVALCVTGRFEDREEWSIGEAGPGNCKNAYPWAMAEKRGKDRVILKLLGLHGYVYSDAEVDEQDQAEQPKADIAGELVGELKSIKSADDLKAWADMRSATIEALASADKERVRSTYKMRLRDLKPTDLLMAG